MTFATAAGHPLDTAGRTTIRQSDDSAATPISPTPIRGQRLPLSRPVRRAGFRIVLAADVCGAVLAALAMVAVDHFNWAQPIAAAVSFALYEAAGLYRPRLSLLLLDDIPALVTRSLMASALVITVTSVADVPSPVSWQVSAGFVTLAAVVVLRSACYQMGCTVRRNGRVAHTTRILGAGSMGRRMADLLLEHPEYGLRPIGFCDTKRPEPSRLTPLSLLGRPEDLAALLQQHGITIFIEAFPSFSESETVQALRICDRLKCEIGPGVLFRQERVGLDGIPFELLKFRSMRPADDRESQTWWTIAEDDRVGPVGHFLRRTSLDELPQLINILRGDMTLVGPRPERPHFVDQFSQHPSVCHPSSRPGGPNRPCAGARPPGRHIHRGARSLRQRLYRDLVPGVGGQDHHLDGGSSSAPCWPLSAA